MIKLCPFRLIVEVLTSGGSAGTSCLGAQCALWVNVYVSINNEATSMRGSCGLGGSTFTDPNLEKTP